MPRLLRNSITAVWFLLMAATLSSWQLGVQESTSAATVAVLAVAFTKAWFVGMYFMELRNAPLPLRLLFQAWIVLVCGVLIGLYLLDG